MFAKLFKKPSTVEVPQQIYGSLMAQSRSEFLYQDFKVPDTVMGRFDMLAMHVYLVARRFRAESETVFQTLNQDVFDIFVADIERALRELGIGDTTVPKRKKKMVRSFYGQIEDFDSLIAEKNIEKLAEASKARYLNDVNESNSNALAQYMLKTEEILAKQSSADLLKGKISFEV